MATTTSKNKVLIYKKAAFLANIGKETLQTLLASALTKHPKPNARLHQPFSGEPQFRWLNYTAKRGRKESAGHLLACEFISCTKGANIGTIEFAQDVDQFEVGAQPPPESKEYIEGAVYFGVLNDHIVILQSNALRTRDLEEHLNWFLKSHAKVLAEENQVALEDNLPGEAFEIKDAQGLELNSPVQFKPEGTGSVLTEDQIKSMRKDGKPPQTPQIENESVRVVPVGRAWEAVKAFMGAGFELPSDMDAEDMLRAGRMRVKLSLVWQNPRGEDSAQFLKNVVHKLRHVDSEDLEYSVKTKSGPITRDTFKPEKRTSIRWGDIRPLFDDLFPKMLEWLEELGKSGRIRV